MYEFEESPDGRRLSVLCDLEAGAGPHYLLNATRLTMCMIPQVAANPSLDRIDEVFTVEQNETGMTNEKLCHRIAMLPMCLSRDQVAAFHAGDVQMSIRRTNGGSRDARVTAEDITVSGAGAAAIRVADVFPKGAVSKRHVTLAVLPPGKGLAVSWEPEVGTGAVHACFDNVSQRTLSNEPDPEIIDREYNKWLVSEAFEDTKALSGDRPREFFEAAYGERCFKVNGTGDPVLVRLTIESENANTSARDFLQWAVDVLEERVNAFEELFARDSAFSTEGNVARFEIDGPGLAYVGQIVKESAYDLFVAKDAAPLAWCASRSVHPLDTLFVVSMAPKKGDAPLPEARARQIVRDSLAALYAHISAMRSSFERTTI